MQRNKIRFAFSKHCTPPNIYKTHTKKRKKKEKKRGYILTIHCSTVYERDTHKDTVLRIPYDVITCNVASKE
jgi:hypothetical protein